MKQLVKIAFLAIFLFGCEAVPGSTIAPPPTSIATVVPPTAYPIQPTPTPYPAQPTLTPFPTQPAPTDKPVATAVPPTAVPSTAVPSPTARPAPTQPAPTNAPAVTNWKPECGNIQVPIGYQVFWSNHRQGNRDPYAVIYDPYQGGSADHPAYGWWYQPCLPAGPERKAHEVAIVLHGGQHRFTGPECKVWQNYDGVHGWELGKLIIDRANVLAMSIAATFGAPNNEAWVAMKCAESWASGGSFERLEPMQ